LLEDVAVGLRPLADAKRVDLTVLAPDDQLEVGSDRRALTQILINFANNAIKFTDEGGSVCIEVSQRMDHGSSVTRFTVSDTGRGIKAEDQDRLFAAFEQVGAEGAQPYGGTGLGLYISRTLATLIGASITFASEFGAGSTFVLEVSEQA
jgi:signal transduction histidine kinase